MDEQQAQRFLAEMFTHLSAEAGYELRNEDYAMQMPQSGERIRSREKMRAFQEAYPTLISYLDGTTNALFLCIDMDRPVVVCT
jgi:cell fate (sporulation/competence/biofilm development) regulator YlbF (YheA/YmcA/DUF963 family)